MPFTRLIHESAWAEALNEFLRDVDTLGDYLAGELCHQLDVKESGIKALSNALLRGGALNATPPYTVAELLVVLLTETPDIAMAARAELRDRILMANSEAVARLYWRRQDAEREAAVLDMDDDSEVVL